MLTRSSTSANNSDLDNRRGDKSNKMSLKNEKHGVISPKCKTHNPTISNERTKFIEFKAKLAMRFN